MGNQKVASGLERNARGMLSGGGGWVFSDVDGFPARKIDWTINEVF